MIGQQSHAGGIMRRLLLIVGVSLWIAFSGSPANAQEARQVAKLAPSDGAPGDQFGSSIALDGDTAVIGTVRGSVYVFKRDDAGEWTEEAKLVVPGEAYWDSPPGVRPGPWLALDRNTVIVGAAVVDASGGRSGVTFVFERNPEGVWMQQAQLTLPQSGPSVGASVALRNGTAIVAEPWNPGDSSYGGSIHQFEQKDTQTWLYEASSSSSVPEDGFGVALAMDADVLVVGTAGYHPWTQRAFHVLERQTTGWEGTRLIPGPLNHGGSGLLAGFSVATSNGTLLIGAEWDYNDAQQVGAAFVFARDESGAWTQQNKLQASDGGWGDHFGVAVALEDRAAVVGANQDWGAIGPHAGSAYYFVRLRKNGEWSERAKLIPHDGDAFDLFGTAVALNGSTAMIGAPGASVHGIESGSVYVWALVNPSDLQFVDINLP